MTTQRVATAPDHGGHPATVVDLWPARHCAVAAGLPPGTPGALAVAVSGGQPPPRQLPRESPAAAW
jgi:hypothetical protein